MPDRLSRRRFLTSTLGAGALVAAGGLESLNGVTPAWGATRPVVDTVASTPVGYMSFTSRPDLRPPRLSIVATPGATAPGEPAYIFATPSNGGAGAPFPAGAQVGLMMFDRQGHLVWFRPQLAATDQAFNFRVQTYKGKPVLTWFQGTLGLGFATAGEYYLADDTYETITTVGPSNDISCDLHEFLLTSEGTALHTAYEDLTTAKLYAGHAMEVDVATNDLLYDWSCYPTVPVSSTYATGNADYFHINSIDLWPGSARNLLISSRNTCAVYLIERSSGAVLWKAGGKDSSFTPAGLAARFSYQHDARPLADASGFSVFDDASTPSPEQQSWAKTLTVNTTHGTVSVAQQYNHATEPIQAQSQGSNQLLPSGERFVGWGAEPWFTQYAAPEAGGGIILDGRWPDGVASYRTLSFYWTGNPRLSELAFVVTPGSPAGSFTGYASWNGATEVATWLVSGGTSSSALTARAAAPRHGFETAIPFTASGSTSFTVNGYDKSGQLLGTSPMVSAHG